MLQDLKDWIADVWQKHHVVGLLKKDMPGSEKEAVTKVWIDDFRISEKKNLMGTNLVDIDTHRIIDLLAVPGKCGCGEWLKLQIFELYPGMLCFHKSAIEQAESHLQQVSDRFHLW